MTNFNSFKRTAQVALIAASLNAGYATLASAHGVYVCARDVRIFCEAAHGIGTDAYRNCARGAHACVTHRHPGSSAPPPPDVPLTSDPGNQLNVVPKFNKMRRR